MNEALLENIREITGRTRRRRRWKRAGVGGAIVAAIGGVGAAYGEVAARMEKRAEAVAVAKLQERAAVHDAELTAVRQELGRLRETDGRLEVTLVLIGARLGVDVRAPGSPVLLPAAAPPAIR